ncbi:hypothetical protein [Klenkia marina]|uniref:hypothetical protein n=1 Tax=Klenkia marina TaxID=1960309 RepID=UPI000B881A1D|nr:hypothetical protein [Klenkia marina]
MTQPPDLPDGQYATWRGRTYPAGPSTTSSDLVVVYAPTQEDPVFRPTPDGEFRAEVPRAEAQVFVLETTCRWRGEPFQVTYAKQPGRFGLTWMGTEPDQVTRLGLRERERGVWTVAAPRSEVTDLVQHRRAVGPTAPPHHEET